MATQWVGQEDAWGCGVAAVAMITGKPYSEVRAHVGRELSGPGKGLSGQDYEVLLAELGWATAKLYRVRHFDAVNEDRKPWPPAPWADLHLAEVIVPSSTQGSHAVVMLADGTVLDPLTPEPRRLSDYERVYWVAAVVPYATTAPA